MIETALSLDREMDEIKLLMPHVWNYQVIHLDEPSEYLYGNMYYMYLDPWIAQMWNNVHTCRTSLYRVIRENLVKGRVQLDLSQFPQAEYEDIKTKAEQVVRSTADAIVASVPQITGMVPFPELSTARRRASDSNINDPSPIQSLHPPGTFL